MLNENKVTVLTELFRALDKDGDGKLNVKEFQLLGLAMTGRAPSEEAALKQLSKASSSPSPSPSADHLSLSLEEWLVFSESLGAMKDDDFNRIMSSYLRKVKEGGS